MQDKFLHYSAEDLLETDAFLAWQRQPERSDLQEAWQQWLKQHPDYQPTVDEAVRLLGRYSFRESDIKTINKDHLWNKIDAATEVRSTTVPVRSARVRNLRWGIGIAASIALIISLFFWLNTGESIQSGAGEQLVYTLPDQSEVILNSNSSLRFSKRNWVQNRRLKLNGEAYFKVKSGSTFSVETTSGTIEVLGTQFNVWQREGQFDVQCTEGRVQVEAANGQQAILSAGQACVLSAGQLNRYTVTEAQDRSAWRMGIFRYQKQQLQLVFKEMEQQFDINIQYPEAIGRLGYTGFFETKKLEDALYQVCWPMELAYDIQDNQVIIRQNE